MRQGECNPPFSLPHDRLTWDSRNTDEKNDEKDNWNNGWEANKSNSKWREAEWNTKKRKSEWTADERNTKKSKS